MNSRLTTLNIRNRLKYLPYKWRVTSFEITKSEARLGKSIVMQQHGMFRFFTHDEKLTARDDRVTAPAPLLVPYAHYDNGRNMVAS